jgi:hypothetical protein
MLRDGKRQDLVDNWVVPPDDPHPAAGLEIYTRERSPAGARIGFRTIPMDEIGLYVDAYRPSLPVDLLRHARAR